VYQWTRFSHVDALLPLQVGVQSLVRYVSRLLEIPGIELILPVKSIYCPVAERVLIDDREIGTLIESEVDGFVMDLLVVVSMSPLL
jgi:hypothetical protein